MNSWYNTLFSVMIKKKKQLYLNLDFFFLNKFDNWNTQIPLSLMTHLWSCQFPRTSVLWTDDGDVSPDQRGWKYMCHVILDCKWFLCNILCCEKVFAPPSSWFLIFAFLSHTFQIIKLIISDKDNPVKYNDDSIY